MRTICYFPIILRAFSSNKPFIRNTKFPACNNCLYFIEHKNNYPYDPTPDDKKYGKCKKFGEINLITGIIDYDYAMDCRLNSEKCGKTGSEYKEK